MSEANAEVAAQPTRTGSLVPGFFVQAVVVALQAERIDMGLLERAVGQRLSHADSGVLSLRQSEYFSLLSKASRSVHNPALGLLVGERLTESNLHMIGPIIVASTTLRSAIDNIRPLGGSMLSGESWQLSEHGSETRFGPAPNRVLLARGPARCDDVSEGWRIATDLVLALAFSCARRFVGPERESSLVAYFAMQKPAHIAPYRRVFDERVRFAAERDAIGFPSALLDVERPGTDPAFAAALRQIAIDRFSVLERESWSRRLEAALRAHTQLAQVDFERIAAQWQISVRTLRRRVEHEGTRLSDVLNRVRFERARQLLSLHSAPIREIAEGLGYGDVSSFQRAFKRWAGVGPGEFRDRSGKQMAAKE